MSRVVRSRVMRNVQRCRLIAVALEREVVERPPRGPVAQRAAAHARLRAHQAWAAAATMAAASYREGSAAREFAQSTADLLQLVVASMQRDLDLAADRVDNVLLVGRKTNCAKEVTDPVGGA